ncbi:signal peptidase I [Pararhodobacter zhoushanensis]|uniref:Signal peptidase I n=1 Tax=Pararhodobacter zhoushanensis TaxID=2479545 RepID=A0ABT3H3S2_9RHOB|nr:signal peptidase I [Pararhodobacter zhoushanensis]MCW1934447.1 signal peptidase I [Pararhodobacter zhoushanensis]
MAAAAEKNDGIWETVKTVAWALLIAGVFRTLFFQPFWIPSGSMKETLLIGDFLFVNKWAYGYSRYSCPFALCPITGRIFASDPERGDVAVFRHPVSGDDLIKRLIGLPGDRIQVREGVLYINDEAVELQDDGDFVETYDRQGSAGQYPRCENAPVGQGGACLKGRQIETLPNGVSHTILNIEDNGFADNTPIFTVPEGHFFFMGDNRDNSVDSRFAQASGGVGFVPFENLIGRADRVMFSSAGTSMLAFWTWRSDRFFHSLHLGD